jgi:hypothetical protein
MNIAAMAIITLVIFAEKTSPWGRMVARATAAVLVAYGALAIAVPDVLPTFSASGGMLLNMPMPQGTASPPTL